MSEDRRTKVDHSEQTSVDSPNKLEKSKQQPGVLDEEASETEGQTKVSETDEGGTYTRDDDGSLKGKVYSHNDSDAAPQVKRLKNNDSDGDDEDEEEEDDEEEDSPQKKKRRRANQFLDIEAEVDDEEEDELDEDDEEAELLREQFISDDHVEKHDGEPTRPDDDRLHRQYDQRRQQAEDQDAEELAETLKQRYRKSHTAYRGDTTASGTVSQKLLMPSINDPAIFAIRCSPGREKDLVRKLYEKKRTLARSGRPLDILSVFQRDAFKGYIYIEAKKPEAIERALSGMVNIYAKQRIIVPVSEYPDLLKQVKSSDVEILPGIYVRISRGKYKGDLAIVDNLSENGLEVRCKLVPRLDYGKNDEFDAEGRRVKSKNRPVPRLFNEQEARMYDAEHLQPGRGPRSFIYRGEEYVEGFLMKDFKLQFIQTKDVQPKLEDLDRFQTGQTEEDGLDLAAVAASLKGKSQDNDPSNAFQPGDKVEVRRGEQAKTVGKVLNVSLNEVSILVLDSGDGQFVNQELTVPATDLRKVFSSGDHVKVIDGVHSDESGLVIKIDGDSVVFLSDQTKQDVRVFANYLIKATDTSSSADPSGSRYDIKDLVQLNASSVGVIVKAEKGLLGILTADARYITVKPSGVASKLSMTRREQVATDKNGLTIKVGDTVKEFGGDKKKEGVILHIYKNAVFVESHELQENLGIFVTNALNVSTVSTKNSMISRTLGPDLSSMNPNVKLQAPSIAPGLKGRIGGRDKLLHKDVIINNGNHKGLMGKVVETDDVDARIELHTKAKKIKVNKTKLSVIVRGESIPYLRFIGASDSGRGPTQSSGPAFSSGAKTAWGGSTPSVGGGTSTWGGKTPSVNAGGVSAWGSAAGGASAWGGGGAGGASTWKGGKGAASTWGNSASGGSSAWGGGGSSSWGSGGNTSAWGNQNGSTSTWGQQNKGNSSTWGSKGGSSTWGNNGPGGGASAWGNRGNSSSWGQKDGNSSAWGSGRTGSSSTWGSSNNNQNTGWGNS
ncbi:hypothetical protein FT663_05216 [Candidozyma haemuli var. vulneris]|uniref:Transcription elongation factor SPT5 n=1 Tax=Candidozyma haemuli TaxID=45357 RepID=A0A2V1AWD9_9ASCO|nr:hypothetical protein CXQ85_004791 [[Candida] haemuloni]KAF3985643.1 hypothetical protein FT663_05216 [[Candida] haemuloni var. vulneris]KAF3986218.1 hypothetical protein FT662_04695 [[Candida] haemuloni var. vulneris]PVH22122.1 hypothetical protein CXQ85_004791 [[Candida] haemuloni]